MEHQSLPFIADDDLGFEEELTRNPYSLKTWVQFIASKKAAPPKVRGRAGAGAARDVS